MNTKRFAVRSRHLCRLAWAAVFALAFACLDGTGAAEVRLPAWLNDHLVLQNGSKLRIFGWARAKTEVKVTLEYFQGTKQTDQAVETDEAGQDDSEVNWEVNLGTVRASKKLTELKLTVAAGDFHRVFTNLVVGEVWLLGTDARVPEANVAFQSTDQIEATLSGRARFCRLATLESLTNATAVADLRPWTLVSDGLIHSTPSRPFSNLAAHLAASVIDSNTVAGEDACHVGIVEVPLLTLRDLGLRSAKSSPDRRLERARKEWEDADATYRMEVAELKKQGGVTNVPAPIRFSVPTHSIADAKSLPKLGRFPYQGCLF